jgi:branched-chain amino acid transport system permease protein
MQKMEQTSSVADRTRFLSVFKSMGLSPVALVLFTVLAVAPLIVEDEYINTLMVSCLLFGAQAMAFDFTAGYINVVNFGFSGLVGLGAYTSALLAVRLGVSPWLGLVGATVVAGIVGFLVGLLTLRLRGIFAAVMAWFVGLTLMELATAMVDLTRGSLGLNVPLFLDTAARRPYYYILLPIVIGIYVLLRVVTRSDFGLACRAIGQNIDVARASGVNPTKYRVINFTISCALAGLLGGYYAHYIGILTPGVMATTHTTEVLVLSYIGGKGSIWGALVAAFLIIPIFEYLKPLMQFRLVLYGVFLVLATIVYPTGLAGLSRSIGEWIRGQRRKAKQNRDQSP